MLTRSQHTLCCVVSRASGQLSATNRAALFSELRRQPAGRCSYEGRRSMMPSVVCGSNRCFSSESFLNGDTSPYIEQMYEHWKQDPKSVHASWSSYFSNVTAGVPAGKAFELPPSTSTGFVSRGLGPEASLAQQTAWDTARVIQLVQGYQCRGHEFANLDPLGLPHELPFVSVGRKDARNIPIDYRSYGFTEADLDRTFSPHSRGVKGFLSGERPAKTLRRLIQRLEETYCGTIGVEVTHIEDPKITNYLRDVLELESAFKFPNEMRSRIFRRTARAHLFEAFCASKFSTSKRFGVEGCESAIVMMKAIAKKAVSIDVESLVIGMPHRGRLNLFTNVLHKPMQEMMGEFQGITGFGGSEWGNTGDVKYHLGVDYNHLDSDAKKHIHLSVMANPSHLEAVDPLVLGQVRAKQYYSSDVDRAKVLPVVMHGDASFAGQGVIYETLQMSKLPDYRVGGTIHLIVNNQIGFTTNVLDQGSGRYPTDIAKCIEAPIFHVNADDPEACSYIADLAVIFRQTFHSDVFINLVGYRRLGHNELDMPKFTQPMMYNIVARHPNVMDIYSKKLIADGVETPESIEKMKREILDFYSMEYEKSKTFTKAPRERTYGLPWRHMVRPGETCPPRNTGVEPELLKEIGMQISTLPDWLKPHPTIGKTYKAREEAIATGQNIDFGLAEALAFASLLNEGSHVRIGGQDVERGTFSHRHCVVHDQTVLKTYCPLQQFVKDRKLPQMFEACNSHLSEFAALGFEVGYALENPGTLAIWEAQFGDFGNGAQIIIDQFIASGETKWNIQCGVVMLLPHGYDGQGPEHSSARIERFLQLCDDREDVIHPESWNVEKRSVIQRHNFQVVNCSTPANFFHVLRRQINRGFRKPLVVISPKRMLKMRATFSRLSELSGTTCFLRYIPNIAIREGERRSFLGVERDLPIDESIERLILCSGQIYYDLAAYREKHGLWNIGIARVEQLSPFPFDRVIDDIRRYPKLKDVVWAQEEPMNAGPWPYTSKRLASSLAHLNRPNGIEQPIYIGRDVLGAPAGGDAQLHQKELERLLEEAFDMYRTTNSYIEKYMDGTSTSSYGNNNNNKSNGGDDGTSRSETKINN